MAHLHLDNSVAAEATPDSPWSTYDLAIDDLHALAAWLGRLPESQRPVALYGKTLLGQATRRLGFTCIQSRWTPYIPFFRLYIHGLMVLHSQEGWRRMERGHVRSAPCYDIWMSTPELLRRYGANRSGSPRGLAVPDR